MTDEAKNDPLDQTEFTPHELYGSAFEHDVRNMLTCQQNNLNSLREELYEFMDGGKKDDRSLIYAALAKAQQEIENADANIENEFLKKKYADLASCLNAVRGPLSTNGIALIQLTADPGQGVLGIRTILAHESGQTIEDLITMTPPKQDPQGVGSCRTYMRRYAVIAMCGIAGALDDDAERTKEDPSKYDRISVEESEGILVTANTLFGSDDDAVVKRMLTKLFSTEEHSITSVTDIPAGKAEVAINLLKNQHKREQDAIAKKVHDVGATETYAKAAEDKEEDTSPPEVKKEAKK